jgi:hypothetical protein
MGKWKWKLICVICVICGFSSPLFAEPPFDGGSGDGWSSASGYCDLGTDYNVACYYGGGGDGWSVTGAVLDPPPGPDGNTYVYYGGSGDGWHMSSPAPGYSTTPNYVYLSNVTDLLAGKSAIQMGQAIAFYSFKLELKTPLDPAQTTALWKRFRIDKYLGATPTATPVADNKIEIQIWCEKNGNGFFDVGDELVSKGQFQKDLCEPGTCSVWLNMKRYPVTVTPKTFYIVFKLADDIGGGQRSSVKVKDSTYMEFDNTEVSNDNF